MLPSSPKPASRSQDRSPAPTLQWRRNGVDLPGESGTVLAIPAAALGDAGSYDLVATNACAADTSAAALVQVVAGVAILVQPVGGSACSGGSASFSVTAAGSSEPGGPTQRTSLPSE